MKSACTIKDSSIPVYRISDWEKHKRLSHGFTTRRGGVSTSMFSSLNFGLSTGDTHENVKANWQSLCDHTGVSAERWPALKQVHSGRVITIKTHKQAENVIKAPPEMDGIITDMNGYMVSVKTADCVPVLLMCSSPTAAGVVHAGWKGTHEQIVGKAVRQMRNDFNIGSGSISAAVGPSIGPCCFEVGKDVAQHFSGTAGKTGGCKYHVNLWQENKQQLLDADVPEKNIHMCNLCTFCLERDFYSHRRDKGVTGRMIAWIGWKG